MNDWGKLISENLKHNDDYYIQPAVKKALDKLDLKSKHIAQSCCSNGRELLSISKCYEVNGTGFDIAENMIEQANHHAKKINLPCQFKAINILDISEAFAQQFDVVIFTIGAITWIEDLDALL